MTDEMRAEMRCEFIDEHHGCPARCFATTAEAAAFTALLARLEISHRVFLDLPPRRLKLPMQTIVVLLETENGTRH